MLPGGMKGKRLYQHLRECGIKATLQEAFQLRETWLRTFKEMNLHFARTPLRQDPRERYAWIPASDDDTSTEDADPKADKRKGRQLYEVTTITGFRRNRTVINSCLNTDFQNPVAHLAKEALWNFERTGLGNRLLNFVHGIVDVKESELLGVHNARLPDTGAKAETSVGMPQAETSTREGR